MKKFRILITLIIVFCAFFAIGCDSKVEQTEAITETQLINSAKHGVVIVDDGFLTGSGVVVESGIGGCVIVTNYHVVATAITQNTTTRIKFLGEDYADAEIIGYCKDYDIAVLKTDYVPKNVYVFNLENNSDSKNSQTTQNYLKVAELGEDILTLGYVGSQLCAYDGILSCTPKLAKVSHLNEDVYLYVIETTAIAPSGTSGGACFDLSGNLIGLNAFSYTENGVMTGISYKIPAQIVASVVKKVTQSASQPFPMATGFTVTQDSKIALIYLGNLTVRVEDSAVIVASSSLAAYPSGSVIATVNGKTADPITFISEVLLTANDTKITLKSA